MHIKVLPNSQQSQVLAERGRNSDVHTDHQNARVNTAAPTSTHANAAAPPPTTLRLDAPFAPPWLVPPKAMAFLPPCPFDVASTDASTVTVFTVCVTIDVANVCVDAGPPASCCAASEKKTRAAPGAGTVISQLFCVWSHWTVSMLSAPFQVPSAPKRGPSVCPAQVMLSFSETEGARRYLQK